MHACPEIIPSLASRCQSTGPGELGSRLLLQHCKPKPFVCHRLRQGGHHLPEPYMQARDVFVVVTILRLMCCSYHVYGTRSSMYCVPRAFHCLTHPLSPPLSASGLTGDHHRLQRLPERVDYRSRASHCHRNGEPWTTPSPPSLNPRIP